MPLMVEMFALQQNSSLPASAQHSLATQQWLQCNALPNVTGGEFCTGQQAIIGSSVEGLSLESGRALLRDLLGNASAADAQ